MLRVGLTGGLGSGKSTIAAYLRELGAYVLAADEVGRGLMQPGQPVYAAILDAFGPSILRPDRSLDRRRLAAIAFGEGRVHELNRIVHPPVVAAQELWMQDLFARAPDAVAVVESALIFEAGRDEQEGGIVPGWRSRFDKLILVTAAEEVKIARFAARALALASPSLDSRQREALLSEARDDARRRLRSQIPDREKEALSDYVLRNDASVEQARQQAAAIYAELQAISRRQAASASASTRETVDPAQ